MIGGLDLAINTESLIAGLFFWFMLSMDLSLKVDFGNKIGPTKAEDGSLLLKDQSFSYQ